MTLNTITYKIDFKLVVIALISVFITFFFHEATHYLTGKSLGYDMWMRLNGVGIADGQAYKKEWHNQLVSISGPLFTVMQASIIFYIIRRTKNLNWYPFLFICALMRIFASVISILGNTNDEARVSQWLGIGKITLPILVSTLLLYFVLVIIKENNINLKLNAALFIIMSMGITGVVFTNPYFIK